MTQPRFDSDIAHDKGTAAPELRAPFPWFGGKSRAASLIWGRIGHVDNYVEPFAGSLAVLLGAPRVHRFETVNDKDGFVANFWRALIVDPDGVAAHADWPVNENDLHARHAWLVTQREDLTARLEGDPDFFDTKIAGWWVWGVCCWIGSGWCSGNGPWGQVDGKLVHLGDAGRGVNRKRVHLGHAGRGVSRKIVHLGHAGSGVNRKLVHLGDAGKGGLLEWMLALRDRLRRVRVCCGDWTRVLGPTPTTKLGLTGVVLDPPYSEGDRDMTCYAVDSGTVAADVRQWALENGNNPKLRIALCGYDTEHEMPGWLSVAWKAQGGYSSQSKTGDNGNKHRETVWFSPHCLNPDTQDWATRRI
jgi:DNA adenine methylase